jgi:carboxylate-amine ligase
MPLRDHIRMTMDHIAGHAALQGASSALHMLRTETEAGQNDARWLRERQRDEKLLAEVSRQAAQRFRGARP